VYLSSGVCPDLALQLLRFCYCSPWHSLALAEMGDLDCYVQVLEPASLVSVSILNCLYVLTIHFCQLLKLWHSLVTRTFSH